MYANTKLHPAIFSLLLVACATPAEEPLDVSSADAQLTVKIFKSDGSRQCEGTGVSPQITARELAAKGITASCAQKSHTGFMYPSVCGADTGRINVVTINHADLKQAEALGFKPLSSLPGFQDRQDRQDTQSAQDAACTPLK